MLQDITQDIAIETASQDIGETPVQPIADDIAAQPETATDAVAPAVETPVDSNAALVALFAPKPAQPPVSAATVVATVAPMPNRAPSPDTQIALVDAILAAFPYGGEWLSAKQQVALLRKAQLAQTPDGRAAFPCMASWDMQDRTNRMKARVARGLALKADRRNLYQLSAGTIPAHLGVTQQLVDALAAHGVISRYDIGSASHTAPAVALPVQPATVAAPVAPAVDIAAIQADALVNAKKALLAQLQAEKAALGNSKPDKAKAQMLAGLIADIAAQLETAGVSVG